MMRVGGEKGASQGMEQIDVVLASCAVTAWVRFCGCSDARRWGSPRRGPTITLYFRITQAPGCLYSAGLIAVLIVTWGLPPSKPFQMRKTEVKCRSPPHLRPLQSGKNMAKIMLSRWDTRNAWVAGGSLNMR